MCMAQEGSIILNGSGEDYVVGVTTTSLQHSISLILHSTLLLVLERGIMMLSVSGDRLKNASTLVDGSSTGRRIF
jgi:hypothetical protein